MNQYDLEGQYLRTTYTNENKHPAYVLKNS